MATRYRTAKSLSVLINSGHAVPSIALFTLSLSLSGLQSSACKSAVTVPFQPNEW